jgi:tetratricopeptide (TPR) repeat protein
MGFLIKTRVMKYFVLLTVTLLTFTAAHSQTLNSSVRTIIQQRSIYLNGTVRGEVDGTSRVALKVDLPPNTKSWYYSFTTTPGESGIANLNLAIQLAALVFDPKRIAGSITDKISVPKGSAVIEGCVMDQLNADLFVRKADLNGGNYWYSRDGYVNATGQAVVPVNELRQGTFYVGLKNPSKFEGVNVIIEVAAIVEELAPFTERQSAAITYADLGWQAYKRGDYDRCLELSKKAIEFDSSFGYIHFNIGLSYLSKGLGNEALDAYTKGIAVTHQSSLAKNTFQAAINDINMYMSSFLLQTEAKDILTILQGELSRY